MISVEEAKQLIVRSAATLNPMPQDISDSLYQVLSEDVRSPINYPPFDQSAMDGFAVQYEDVRRGIGIEIIGESPAGNPFKKEITAGQSVRIFTGGKIPAGADTVIVQEKVAIEKGKLIAEDGTLIKGSNVREGGSQVRKGDIILKKGTLLNAGAIGFLAGLGISSVHVYPKPRVSLLITGTELKKPGLALLDGEVYESNSFALTAALKSMNISVASSSSINDDEQAIRTALSSFLENSDILLISGGISVGKYDYTGKCLHELDVKNIFYKISQKPGKPIFFGKKNNCLVFGLPGNPSSALSCFYEYVFPALRIMQGFSDISLKITYLEISSDYKKKAGLSLFLKGKFSGNMVEVLQGQDSNNIGSFAFADCLIYLPAEKEYVKSGEKVEVHLLPQI